MTQVSADPLTADVVEQALVFVGLTGMYDPPRPEARNAIKTCRAAGIRVMMITGDHPNTASAIARELGIASDGVAVTGVDLDRMADDELRQRAPDVSVYARVTAPHMLRIVRALKAADAVVAMTGDGVNDAPAIKGADIGIAMRRSGTDVTKQAADMIITDDNVATIVAAELLRSFGARSDHKPVWRVPLRTNLNLVAVVALSVGLQFWVSTATSCSAYCGRRPCP
ncbi:MAG: HAD-IC family P-type ATPase [Vicinamibacterales bacterium]|nr:HAD-IC family P-type ATPase [Vicinamibacterales bacterium]